MRRGTTETGHEPFLLVWYERSDGRDYGTTEKFTKIHAAQMTTQREYEESAEFMARLGVDCPEFFDLKRGGSF
jgi:hypothetical protein